MKKIKELKTGDKFWHCTMMYKVIKPFKDDTSQMRAKCVTYGGTEIFKDPDFTVSTKGL